jgi:hypothetical protein
MKDEGGGIQQTTKDATPVGIYAELHHPHYHYPSKE